MQLFFVNAGLEIGSGEKPLQSQDLFPLSRFTIHSPRTYIEFRLALMMP
jgi:hypothetical protein